MEMFWKSNKKEKETLHLLLPQLHTQVNSKWYQGIHAQMSLGLPYFCNMSEEVVLTSMPFFHVPCGCQPLLFNFTHLIFWLIIDVMCMDVGYQLNLENNLDLVSAWPNPLGSDISIIYQLHSFRCQWHPILVRIEINSFQLPSRKQLKDTTYPFISDVCHELVSLSY